MKILVPVDGSPYTKRMLAYLAAHDEWLGGLHQYTVLHSVPAVPPRAAAVLDKDVLKSYYDDEAEKVLKTVRTFFGKQKIAAEFVAKVGPAADTIAAVLKKGKYDLVIMVRTATARWAIWCWAQWPPRSWLTLKRRCCWFAKAGSVARKNGRLGARFALLPATASGAATAQPSLR